MALYDFSGRVFRASRDFEIVLYDRLSDLEQHALAELRSEPDFYGVLKPRAGTAGTVKAVGRDMALLYLTLREPGCLPSYVDLTARAGQRQEIAQLVLDGVLEVEVDGSFLSGPEAALAFGMRPAQEDVANSRLAQLSHDALRYASALPTDEPVALSSFLYGYNRLPISPHLAERLRGTSEVLRFLRIDNDNLSGWVRAKGREDSWVVWSRSSARRASPSAGFWHKLYVSPAVETLPLTVRSVLDALSGSRSDQVKIGAGAAGLHRPDKIVAYFTTFEDLVEGAEQVRREVGGAEAHGVPFSAEIDQDGLVSWGMDPPLAAQLVSWRGPESWRSWVANRLGLAISQCKRTKDASITPWLFALERLRMDGIDVERWTPNTSIWNAFITSGE